MPRAGRFDAPCIVQHVLIRRIERRRIFLDHRDRDNLPDRLSDLPATRSTGRYARAWLPDRAHLFCFALERLDRLGWWRDCWRAMPL